MYNTLPWKKSKKKSIMVQVKGYWLVAPSNVTQKKHFSISGYLYICMIASNKEFVFDVSVHWGNLKPTLYTVKISISCHALVKYNRIIGRFFSLHSFQKFVEPIWWFFKVRGGLLYMMQNQVMNEEHVGNPEIFLVCIYSNSPFWNQICSQWH